LSRGNSGWKEIQKHGVGKGGREKTTTFNSFGRKSKEEKKVIKIEKNNEHGGNGLLRKYCLLDRANLFT